MTTNKIPVSIGDIITRRAIGHHAAKTGVVTDMWFHSSRDRDLHGWKFVIQCDDGTGWHVDANDHPVTGCRYVGTSASTYTNGAHNR